MTFEGQSWRESSFPCGDRSHSSLLEGRDKVAQACQDLCYELRLEVVASQHQCGLASDFDTLAGNRLPTIARCTKNRLTLDRKKARDRYTATELVCALESSFP